MPKSKKKIQKKNPPKKTPPKKKKPPIKFDGRTKIAKNGK